MDTFTQSDNLIHTAHATSNAVPGIILTTADHQQQHHQHSFMEYDERGQMKKYKNDGSSYSSDDDVDVEAQEISDEFKRPPY